MNKTYGLFDALSINLRLVSPDGKKVTNRQIAEGDTITNLVVAAGNYGSVDETTYETAKVVGFTMRPAEVNHTSKVMYDGVGMTYTNSINDYMSNLMQRVTDVRDMIVEVPVSVEKVEDETTTHNDLESAEPAAPATTTKRIQIGKIVALNGSDAEEGDGSSDGEGDDNGDGAGVEEKKEEDGHQKDIAQVNGQSFNTTQEAFSAISDEDVDTDLD